MKTLLSKKIVFIVLFIFNFLFLANGIAFAAPGAGNANANPVPTSGGIAGGSQYTPITPGYQSFFGGDTSFEGMIQRIFILSIFFIVILSVIMIIWGGVEYMGSESVFAKGAGKERIFAALSGLLIALVSILLISTLVTGLKGDTLQINIFQTSS